MADESSILDALWIEKYRPVKIEDLILEDKQKEFLSRQIEKGELPHLALFGPPGSGKTTCCQILESYIIRSNMDILELNGSRHGTINVARGDIAEFVKSPPMESNHKVVFIDELDGSSLAFQKELRSTAEMYADTTRFMVTGNETSSIHQALFSRFQTFIMDTISEEFAMKYCKKILEKEEIIYDEDEVKLVVESLLPDVRKIVNVIQQNTNTDNKKFEGVDRKQLINTENKVNGLVVEICDELDSNSLNKDKINSNISNIQETIGEDEPDYLRIYQNLFYSKIPAWAKITVNKYAKQHKECVFPSMHFMACVYEIVQNAQKFKEEFG